MSEFSGPAMSVNAVVQTANGSKYLQQLCKHFAHKVPATWTETEGQAALPAGTVRFTAAADSLHMQCEAEDAGTAAHHLRSGRRSPAALCLPRRSQQSQLAGRRSLGPRSARHQDRRGTPRGGKIRDILSVFPTAAMDSAGLVGLSSDGAALRLPDFPGGGDVIEIELCPSVSSLSPIVPLPRCRPPGPRAIPKEACRRCVARI